MIPEDESDVGTETPAPEGTAEQRRLAEMRDDWSAWRRWGPYVSERAWGTVREDYSPDGRAWDFLPHDMARSKAYRWGEDGIAGICDRFQILCFAPAFWNGRDPILKERLFGLTPFEGNHGEDVNVCYFHVDNLPSHAYMRYLYKYPQAEYPYVRLIEENRRRAGQGPEFELTDTGIFDEDRYFDIEIEYAKGGFARTSASGSRRRTAGPTRPPCTSCRTSGSATPGAGARRRALSR